MSFYTQESMFGNVKAIAVTALRMFLFFMIPLSFLLLAATQGKGYYTVIHSTGMTAECFHTNIHGLFL